VFATFPSLSFQTELFGPLHSGQGRDSVPAPDSSWCEHAEFLPTVVRITVNLGSSREMHDLAARQLHAYGGAVNSSPTLDRLAAQGARFDHCYTTFPMCLPSRATMLTGRTPGIHGHLGGATRLLADDPTYATLLGRAGYRIGGFGKFHREGTGSPHPRVLDDLGFHESVIVEDDKRGPYLDWIRERHPTWYGLALGRLGKCKGHLTPEQEALRERA